VARPERAPAGHASVSVLVHFAPYELEGGWTADARERLGDVVVAELERHFPGATEAVTAREVLTPADIEERYGVTGGHVHHGEHALDQLITRPTVHTARYATPIAGLFLGGGGSHPGGGVTCAPGALAARTILAAG
jgi:phytoene dehydrogenase-like protein